MPPSHGPRSLRAIADARTFSEDKLSALRLALAAVAPAEACVVTCGSYSRREASPSSDIDYFIILPGALDGGPKATQPWQDDVAATIEEIVPLAPSSGGAFARIEHADDMVRNIGGESDSNSKITRRMLMLLEGEWLTNESRLRRVRRSILERYIGEHIGDHQLALFLLNDLIRYYRTMMVDYEFKTMEGSKPKPWGLRNIKLVFSRKLLYASGLFSVAMTADRNRERKIARLEELFDMPVIDRIVHICGDTRSERLRESYAHFLDRISQPEIRTALEALPRERRDDDLFRDLKNEGHNFTREIMKVFELTFDSTHPIRRAVLF